MKKTLAFVSASFLALSLFGCSNTKQPEEVTYDFVESVAIQRDVSKVENYVTDDLKDDLALERSATLENSNSIEYAKFKENLEKFAQKTNYVIEETNNPNKFKVEFTYIDLSEPIGNGMDAYKEKIEQYEGTVKEPTNEKENLELIYKEMNEQIEGYKGKQKTIHSTIKIKRIDGKPVIYKVGGNLIKAFSFGFLDRERNFIAKNKD